MKRIITILCLITIVYSLPTLAQTVDEIKRNRDIYLWGEGDGQTINKADAEAISQISSQISLQVESKFSKNDLQTEKEGNTNFGSTVSNVINTYSSSTLTNTERIILSEEPEAKVFRYIKRSDINKVFEQRKNKIFQYVKDGISAEEKHAIGDAMKYYYWALILLKSHPDCNDILLEQANDKKMLVTWLPASLNRIFADMKISVGKFDKMQNQSIIYLNIFHTDKPVANFDYTYWTGNDWASTVSAKDGIGTADFYGAMSQQLKSIQLKADYICTSEAVGDKELSQVMGTVPEVYFKNAKFVISLETKPVESLPQASNAVATSTNEVKTTNSAAVYTEIKNEAPVNIPANELGRIKQLENPEIYKTNIQKVISAIETKNYASVSSLFTPEGLDVFNKLVTYGKAVVINKEGLSYYSFGNNIIARSVKMRFSFTNNTKVFIEDITFTLNKDGLVDGLAFSLDEASAKYIASIDAWPENERMTIINFLEQFKTAYALKRLDYIESVFSDDCYIIVGKKLERTSIENGQALPSQVEFSRLTKQQYIRNLKNAFTSKEYINIKFEDCKIMKSLKNQKAIYGINLSQRYFSSNYGDFGYLFLRVDYSNPEKPMINVRVWSPTPKPDGSLYSLSDFF
jgi:hypothetical protein